MLGLNIVRDKKWHREIGSDGMRIKKIKVYQK
jgi:hypothetical protein